MIQFLKRNWGWFIVIIILLFGKNLLSDSDSLSGISTFSSTSSSYSALESLSSDYDLGTIQLTTGSVTSNSSDSRIIIQTTGLSLQVKDVNQTVKDIQSTAENLGGFLINSTVSQPEDAATGSISIRVPVDKRDEAMTAFKDMAVKVVSESVYSNDITDEYADLESRLEILTKTKTKYEQILDQATQVTDILAVQNQLTSLQTQIDNLKGQQKYYDQAASLTKITVYVSTDELSLPYSPTDEWRPKVIFKNAVRSLISTFRGIGSAIIWIFTFLPIIIPVVVVIWFIKRKKRSKLSSAN